MTSGPNNCVECRFGKRYGCVGDHYCTVLEEYFTNNAEPPYKERPDECPYNNICFAIVCDAVAKAEKTFDLAHDEMKRRKDTIRRVAEASNWTTRQIKYACESAEAIRQNCEEKHAIMHALTAMQTEMMKVIKEAHRQAQAEKESTS